MWKLSKMDFNYSEEQLLVQKTAMEFARDHLLPGAVERDEKMEFPAEQIEMLGEFYMAENYHQDYFNKNPNAPYCQYVIAPKLKKLKLAK